MTNKELMQILEADAEESGLIRQRMIETISLLSKDEQKVLRFRFGLDDDKNNSMEETARRFGITTGEAEALEMSAMQKLENLTNKPQS